MSVCRTVQYRCDRTGQCRCAEQYNVGVTEQDKHSINQHSLLTDK
jgi:hypothetical protein